MATEVNANYVGSSTAAACEVLTAKMILNGKRVDSTSGQVFEVRNPATQDVIACVPKGNAPKVTTIGESRRTPHSIRTRRKPTMSFR